MVKTRFAPSPTGDLHIGSLRTALYAYALAKKSKGKFVLRIEDTDKKREVEGSVETIKMLLNLFGLHWDEYYVQSERVKDGYYGEKAKKLVDDGHAFYCQCSSKNAKEDGFSEELRDPCRDKGLKSGAIKLRVPDRETVAYTDFVLKKRVKWDTSTVSDTTLLKSDGFPTYHLAVVVDDTMMEISHVLRAQEWMPSTPIHILVYKYLGLDMPEIGHPTAILDPEGGKLSKRKGSVSCRAMLDEGYLAEAILNFTMLLGWAPKDNREFFTLDDFVEVFDSDGFQKSNPIFDRKKLNWMNGEYIRSLTIDDFITKVKAFDPNNEKLSEKVFNEISPLIQTRIKLLSEFYEMTQFFLQKPGIDKSTFTENFKNHLGDAIEGISEVDNWSLEELNKVLMSKITEKQYVVGKFFLDLRIAITGKTISPPINESIIVLGKDEALARIRDSLHL